ncbi:mucin-2-like [Ylistrum balloti]|uniref:mucin-2-like n=1 Tax=Ylistrum balloti TaxID=509963 RepID=UPI002905966E|nr:mucin-2-like [Ylistrum balloti]
MLSTCYGIPFVCDLQNKGDNSKQEITSPFMAGSFEGTGNFNNMQSPLSVSRPAVMAGNMGYNNAQNIVDANADVNQNADAAPNPFYQTQENMVSGQLASVLHQNTFSKTSDTGALRPDQQSALGKFLVTPGMSGGFSGQGYNAGGTSETDNTLQQQTTGGRWFKPAEYSVQDFVRAHSKLQQRRMIAGSADNKQQTTTTTAGSADHDIESTVCEFFSPDCPSHCIGFNVFGCTTCTCSFLFSSSSKSDSCSNLIFTCQPLCFKRSSTGCTCDCTNQANPMINPNFDPSNPSGSMVQPSDNPANPSGPYIPGSLQCSNDWMNCHSPCSPSIDFKTGCPHCQCPQSPTPSSPTMSTPSTDPTKTTPTTPSGPRRTTPTTPTGPTSTTTLITQSTSYQPSKTKSPTVSTASQSTTVIPTTAALHSVTATTSTVSSSPSTTMFPVSSTSSSLLSNTPASTTPNVVLPVVQTTPHPPTHAPTSTLAPSTTMTTIACPGIFSCFKDCFTGYKSDANGCPLCECEPLPTGIPYTYKQSLTEMSVNRSSQIFADTR